MERKQARVLVIDDEPAVRESIAFFLEDHAFSVLRAENGRVGLALFRQKKPDLLLVDLRMPEVDGLEVIATVAKEAPGTPTIVVSGTGVLRDAITAIRLGAWDYLLKPIVDLSALEHTVRKALDRARLLRENEAYRLHLEDMVRKRTAEFEAANTQLREEALQRHRAQEELRRLNEHLEQMVAERTEELEQANRRLQNSLEILRDDQDAGRMIQFSLLPAPDTTVGSFRFRRMLKPSMHMSGDFLDFFEIGDDTLGFYMADVAGHGVPSAFVTVLLKSLMSSVLARFKRGIDQTILDPAALMAELNTEFIERGLERHITFFFGLLHRDSSRLTFANAGQFPFPILCQEGQAEFIPSRGTPIGMFESSRYANAEIGLGETFTLVIFSDGVLEILPEQGLAGKTERLRGLVGADDLSLPSLVEGIGIDQWESLPDDIAILMIGREGGREP